jgi:hypothetical protein
MFNCKMAWCTAMLDQPFYRNEAEGQAESAMIEYVVVRQQFDRPLCSVKDRREILEKAWHDLNRQWEDNRRPREIQPQQTSASARRFE